MFTGIIEEIGTIKAVSKYKNLLQLTVLADRTLKGVKLGDSIAVNGACLTVVRKSKGQVVFDVMQETLLKTNIGALKVGDRVNLERPMKNGARVHGHFVTGHVDDVCDVKEVIRQKNYVEMRIVAKGNLRPFLVSKGSVCVDGVSLTVGKVLKGSFSVHLIPYTLKETILGERTAGERVNVETDVLAKYVLNKAGR